LGIFLVNYFQTKGFLNISIKNVEINEDFELRLGPRPKKTTTTREPRIKSNSSEDDILGF
jgi:hypothetical protein